MKKIVLISCCKQKKSIPSPAKDIYISTLFKYSFRYANTLHPDKILILSAKHGLLELEEIIEPYNKTLNDFTLIERKKWSNSIIVDLKKIADLDFDHFTILAGNRYCQFILPHLNHYSRPLEGLSIGKQLQFLKKRINNE